jgi:hypothetical protein
LDEDPTTLYDEKTGPDSRLYKHVYLGLGIFSNHDQENGGEIKVPNSFDMMFGLRYKLKVLSFYALGVDASYRFQKYCINNETLPEDDFNPFSINRNSDRQVLASSIIGLEIFNRLKLGRGNNLGYYIDAGIRGEWNYSNKLKVFEEFENSPAGKVKRIEKKLDYINKTALIATGRIGFKKTIIYGNYRLSDLISEKYSTPDLPGLSIGLQRAF